MPKRRQAESAPADEAVDVINIDASQEENVGPLEQMIEDAVTDLRNQIAHKQREDRGDTGNAGTVNAQHIWSSGFAWEVAKRKPKTLEELEKIPRCSKILIKKYGAQILETVRRAIDDYHAAQVAEGQQQQQQQQQQKTYAELELERQRRWAQGYTGESV